MSDLNSNPTTCTESESRQLSSREIFLAALLTMLAPGTGHLVSGKRSRGILFLVLFVVMLVLYWPVRLPQYYPLVLLLVFYALALFAAATLDVIYAKRLGWTRPSLWWLLSIPLFVGIASWAHSNLWLRAAGFGVFAMPSQSMEKTVGKGDCLLVDLRYYKSKEPSTGDIIIFRKNGLFVMKRLITAGGSTIDGRAGEVFVDGRKLVEPYALHEGQASYELDNFGPVAVPVGKLFVMGDNRNMSLDSRTADYGPIDRNAVYGRPLYVVRTAEGQLGPELR